MTRYAVNRDLPIPVYYQIALDLRQRISRGEWRAGNKLPAEPDLAEQYHVSRMTMRQAIAELVKNDTLVRRRGDGTYVNQVFFDITWRPSEVLPAAAATELEKSSLRHQVWAELRQVAVPDSRFHWNFEEFVPDFQGSDRCAGAIHHLAAYQQSRVVFLAPDNSLAPMRQLAIQDGKRLVVATFGIGRGFLLIEPGDVPVGEEAFAATLDGIELYGRQLSLVEVGSLGGIDLLITGISLATEQGVRWGKGHGFFDLEWGMFREIGAVGESTPVIAVGHDCQVVSRVLEPSEVDTIADYIVTPTRVIEVEKVYAKPGGILWDYVSPELIQQIPPLRELYESQRAGAQS